MRTNHAVSSNAETAATMHHTHAPAIAASSSLKTVSHAMIARIMVAAPGRSTP